MIDLQLTIYSYRALMYVQRKGISTVAFRVFQRQIPIVHHVNTTKFSHELHQQQQQQQERK